MVGNKWMNFKLERLAIHGKINCVRELTVHRSARYRRKIGWPVHKITLKRVRKENIVGKKLLDYDLNMWVHLG